MSQERKKNDADTQTDTEVFVKTCPQFEWSIKDKFNYLVKDKAFITMVQQIIRCL